MEHDRCCGTCRWHKVEFASTDPDWVCCNEASVYYADYTGYKDMCPDWEER